MTDPKKYTIHMVGHGHIDSTWLWRWMEGYEEVRATFRSALDRMNETDDFKFTASSACFYAWVKACDPEMFEEIRARVAEGRWSPEMAGDDAVPVDGERSAWSSRRDVASRAPSRSCLRDIGQRLQPSVDLDGRVKHP